MNDKKRIKYSSGRATTFLKKFLRAYDEIKFFHSFGIDIVLITSHKNSVFALSLYASFFFSWNNQSTPSKVNSDYE